MSAVLAKCSFTRASSFWFSAQVSSREIPDTKSFLAIDLIQLHGKYFRSKSLRDAITIVGVNQQSCRLALLCFYCSTFSVES